MGGKGAKSQNSQMVQFEMQQAAEARQKEEDRKRRLEEGMAGIESVFRGTKKQGSAKAKLDLSGVNPAFGPQTFGQSVAIGDSGWTYKPVGYGNYEAYDPQGNMAAAGDWANVVGQIHGREYDRGFDSGYENDPFGAIKSNYKTSLNQLHSANLNKSYNDALEEALFAHARAGQMGSTTRADTEADIGGRAYQKQSDGTYKAIDYGQYGEAKNKISSSIDKSMSDLNSQIQSAEDAAEQQLYMTEDPGQALTEAHKLAGNISPVPQYNSLGDLFKPLVIGATGFYSGYQGQSDFNKAFGPTSKSPFGSGSGKVTQS